MFAWLLGRVYGPLGQASQNIQDQMLLPLERNAADCAVRSFPKGSSGVSGWRGSYARETRLI
jgi:hypothetical protein